MSNEAMGKEIGELLETVRPELTPTLEARAVAAIEAARGRPVRRRTPLVAVAVGAAVVLFGLGFVPIPLGPTKGALEKAMAAFEGTSGFYKRCRELAHGDIKDRTVEVWGAPGGLLRIEYWEEGKLQNWQVMGADYEAYWNPEHRWAEVYDLPPADPQEARYDETLEGIGEMLADRLEHTGTTTVTEWRERSLWGGEVLVIEAVEPLEDPAQGWRRMRYELDAGTGRLLAERHWRSDGRKWKLVAYSEEVGWDVDIPSEAWTFAPPKGWRVKYHRWWTGRVDKVLASGETQDWEVTVHTIDADKNGDLVITLSRMTTREVLDELDREVGVHLTATDSLGVTYEADVDGYRSSRRGGRQAPEYWIARLRRMASATPPGVARTVTLSVEPAACEAYADQVVTFPELPIPPLQEKVEEETEVVQY